MPRKVDHGQRRELLADALMRLAAARGLAEVSLRHVATEAGVSAGMVQHYFRTKDEMMTFALRVVMDRIRQRSQAAAVPTSPRELVRSLLLQLLPLDRTRRLENHVALAFLAYAAVKPAIAVELRQAAAQIRAFLAEQLRTSGQAGIDPEPAATGLLALVDGLGLQLLSDQYAEPDAVAVLEAHLTLLFGEPGSDSRPQQVGEPHPAVSASES